MCAQAGAGSASESAAAPRNAERTRRSVRAAMLRSSGGRRERAGGLALARRALVHQPLQREGGDADDDQRAPGEVVVAGAVEHQASHPGAEERADLVARSEEHTSELQSPCNLVCRLLLEKKNKAMSAE